ncbi:hydrogenase expression/formation protein HypE [Campylobacter sp. LR185c]|uniref:hydrogenase expression/formation protein HypE n=1 Tax=Campylobacter sp. LR185c TaxID=2014525 RepID=UPI0012382709|nr:hydrogenase expression/formation protein HypE [Campylobacter sp. LR185c]KAA6228792.1 hydrogenase expression/formation protein HypE [Campylobacter sp. LR185c]KAA8604155.1 hydrogenase expression/formation protein HypE [Campylobacter sp. LR185c]
MKQISLAHGGGGEEMNELITELIFKTFDNEILRAANDSAILSLKADEIALSTDSFTLSPLFLDEDINIGKLCVVGSTNDILMVGAKPLFMSLAFIIEEGFSFDEFEKILQSIKEECIKNDIKVVCGDTKVVPKDKGDKIYINTTMLGQVIKKCECKNLKNGLDILISGDIGRHGASVLIKRNDLDASIKSDCKSLKDEVLSLLNANVKIIAMRDATRGGLSGVLNEWAKQGLNDILIYEEKIIIQDEVKGLCELFGYEAYELANEGTFVLCVEKEDSLKALEILQNFNKNANLIGEILNEKNSRVILQTAFGAKRFLESPKGELLPRIC